MVNKIRLEDLEAAVKSLQRALEQPKDEFVRDSAIQRFEFCFELSWKVAQKILQQFGVTATSPRSAILEMHQQGWIPSSESWLKFLDDRNLTVHTYREDLAQEIFDRIPLFLVEEKKLLEKFKSLVKS